MSFTPDAEFPIINIEKGAMHGTLRKNRTVEGSLLSMKAGVAVNAVPQKAVMEFKNLSDEEFNAAKLAVEKECSVQIQRSGNTVTVIGVGAHASTPHLGKNAGLAALSFAVKLPSLGAEDRKAFEAVLALFPAPWTSSRFRIKKCTLFTTAVFLSAEQRKIVKTWREKPSRQKAFFLKRRE